MISIVCVYNNKEIFEEYLLKSLKSQNINYELILLENTQKKFKSAAEALNYGGKKANGEYILFVHQDMDMCSGTFLKDLERILDSISNLGIAGVAGKSEKGLIVSNMKQGMPPKFAGKIQINKPVKVQTLDECLFVIPKKIFNLLKFDEKVCDGWHLYAVDYCLCVKERGLTVYVLPVSTYHKSIGESLSKDYYDVVKKLLKKHAKNYKWIYTTIGNWNSVYPLSLQIVSQKLFSCFMRFRMKF